MNAREHRPRRIPRIRITPFQLWLLCAAVFFAAITPTGVQFILSGVMIAFAGVAMTVTNLRKEPAPPEVFLEEEHFEGGGNPREFRHIRKLPDLPAAPALGAEPYRGRPRIQPGVRSGAVLWTMDSSATGHRASPARPDVALSSRRHQVRSGLRARVVLLDTRAGIVLACLEQLNYPIASDAPKQSVPGPPHHNRRARYHILGSEPGRTMTSMRQPPPLR